MRRQQTQTQPQPQFQRHAADRCRSDHEATNETANQQITTTQTQITTIVKPLNSYTKWRSRQSATPLRAPDNGSGSGGGRDCRGRRTVLMPIAWQRVRAFALGVLLVCGCVCDGPLRVALADCPSVCECKWKSGKESVLCLSANLTQIPAPLDAGTQVLELTGNDIAIIQHDTFAAANLLNLQKVHLARCRLHTIERHAFRKLINLVELDLSHNQLASIPTAAFEYTPELRELRLSGNPIQRVPDGAFVHVPQLVRLELSECRVLAVIEPRAFAGLEASLEWLKLDGNRLSEVRAGTITSLAQLHGIELANNQWNCSCALRPLRAWMLRENIPCGVPPLCRAPPRLAGRAWDKLELDDFACVPQIIATDTNAHGVEGRNVTMSCYVAGVPEPSVRWLVKNRVIANLSAVSTGADGLPAAAPRTAAATQGRKTYVVNMLRNASNLTILTADMQDAGIYTCAAENKAGKVEASVTLAVSRKPPEAPLGAKIVLLCVLIALLFVVGSSFVAICFCTLRRKRKMRLWNSVPPARTESYEKIEMTTRGIRGAGGGGKHDDGGKRDAILAGVDGDAHSYLRNATTPLNCGSDDGGDIGVAIVNPSGGGSAKRNGDYRNIPTHCDDDDDGGGVGGGGGGVIGGIGIGDAFYRKGWKGVTLRTSNQSPQENSRQQHQLPHNHHKSAPASSSTTATAGQTTAGGGGVGVTNAATALLGLDETDLHIPRLIDLGSNPDSASSSISGQVDAATRHANVGAGGVGGGGGFGPHPLSSNWTNTPIATTKINSPHSKLNGAAGGGSNSGPYYGARDGDEAFLSDGNSTTHDGPLEHDLFDSNYPDLLDIAKYAVAQVAKSGQMSGGGMGVTSLANGPAMAAVSNAGLCTLPRKLKNTGKYFKHSSDSQSPLLADNSSSSKYGSSTLGVGDYGFLNDVALGRRFSAESTYSTATYTTGQRANSFLNLVHSANKSVGGSGGAGGLSTTSMASGGHALSVHSSNLAAAAAAAAAATKRNPSLPSSPVHELHQHQRSFSSAATPLLDFSTLTTRTAGAGGGGVSGAGGAPGSNGVSVLPPATTSSVTAYDYHAAQLERFLEEYRNLQDQLCKMKETCETIRKKEAPLRVAVGQSAQLADPVMFNAAMAASAHSPNTNPKTTMLKNKAILPGQPPDPPPYWLHRNAMLKRLNDSQTDIFKS